MSSSFVYPRSSSLDTTNATVFSARFGNPVACAGGYAERDVLWNTKPIQASLALIDSMGDDVLEEDLARLSPLKWGHINMFGEVLHPLRDPSAFLGLELEL